MGGRRLHYDRGVTDYLHGMRGSRRAAGAAPAVNPVPPPPPPAGEPAFSADEDGVLVLDLQGHVLMHNERFARMWQLPEALLARGEDEPVAAHMATLLADPAHLIGMMNATRDWPEMETLQTFELLDGRRFERHVTPQRVDGRCVGVRVRWRDAGSKARRTVQGRVLYIDDHEVNRELMAVLLESRPQLQLMMAATGQEGLEMARRWQPDLVLLDIRLPDIDGFAVLRALRAEPLLREVPCLAVSAAAMPHEVAAATVAGFDAYLTKPVDVQALLREVDQRLAPPAAA
jgi:CheY-like chemotaxis protein